MKEANDESRYATSATLDTTKVKRTQT